MTTCRAALLLAVALVLGGCAGGSDPVPTEPTSAAPAPAPPQQAPSRELAADPVGLADDLVHDERALRDPSSSEEVLAAAAHRQQAAYRTLGRHPEWDPIARPRIPPDLLESYDLNIDARRNLSALGESSGLGDTLPAWRIVAPAPAEELLGYYREAEAASGVPWAHLAAINLIETGFGRIAGTSTAGAQGPMQFMPGTWAQYGAGGDIHAPRDSILAAGRFLAAQGFAADRDNAVFRYNNSDRYVRAVNDYAAVLAADPAMLHAYHRWEVYYVTTAGDVLLPVGYAEPARIPVAEYRARGAAPAVRMSERSAQTLDRMLAAPDPSSEFLGIPYGADTLIGSATEPEQLVVDLERVDCFTYADYVEALKRAEDRDGFLDALRQIRYRDGVVAFDSRRHFFTDWAPTIATDVTATVSDRAVEVSKNLNQQDAGGLYLPGLPVVPRTMSYIPSAAVDDQVLSALRPGDYIGAYAEDGGLDVTHVGIFVAGPDGPLFRNASSLAADQQVVDTPLRDYLRTVPGIVVLRPVL